MKNLLSAAALGLALVFGGMCATSAQAGHSVHCHYKTVIVYKTVSKPVVRYITKFDHCGKPYRVKVIKYVHVRVPVKKLVKVCH